MKNVQASADKAAVILSLACAMHCLLLPVALVMLPALAILPLADESFHQLLLLGVIPVSLLAMVMGCRRHRSGLVASAGLMGLGLLLFAALFGHDLLGEAGEKLFTLLGSASLVFGHIQNYKRCQSNDCEQDSCH